MVLVAPFAEEFVYRGLVMGVLLARGWSPLFGGGPGGGDLCAPAFPVRLDRHPDGASMYGLVLGLLRVASGGLFLPIMAHLFINLISLAV
jgi:membrane protease YdiL (CAAX protease family)